MKKIQLKNTEQIEAIRESCLLVSKTHAEVASFIKEGVTTLELDKIAEEFIRDHGARPAFKGFNGFPYTLCASLNEAVVHGFCNDKPLTEKDVISLDCGVEWNGYYGDSAFTYLIGEGPSPAVLDLCRVTWESLELGIQEAKVGKRTGDIGYAIQQYAERKHRYGIVRELVGHGIGKNLHEPPEVPNYGKKNSGKKIEEGLVIAIEPMINMGKKNVHLAKDGWTIITTDGLPSAHYEHSIAVTKDGPEKLSDFNLILKSIRNNDSLFSFENFSDLCTP